MAEFESKNLRIAIVGPASPFRGGIAHFSNRLAQALAEYADVRLITFSRQYPKLLFPGKTQLEPSNWDLPSEPERLLDSIDPRSWGQTGRRLAELEPDVIMLVHWLPFFVPAYLGVLRSYRKRAKGEGARVCLFLHNIFPHKSFPMTRPLMNRLLARGDCFFTLSGQITDDLEEFMTDKPVYEGFHPVYDIFEPAIAAEDARDELNLPQKPTLLFFGYVRRYKGLDLVIEAMPRILESMDAQLIVAGEFYDGEDKMRQRIRELGLGDGASGDVRLFSDYIPNEEVHLYFSAADVVVQPYRSATPSGVAQTAFYFEKPMIVTDLGVLAEVVPHEQAGLVVPPEDPDAIAGAVIEFFERGADFFQSGVAEQRKRYSWDRLARQLTKFLEGV